jgi:hypothetical protein
VIAFVESKGVFGSNGVGFHDDPVL